mgnify:CR=1 FL=1
MSAHSLDAANANIIGSGATAATVATTSALGVINEYAVVIGLLVSIISLIAGICFKISSSRKEALLREEELRYREQEAERARQQFDALAKMVEISMNRD